MSSSVCLPTSTMCHEAGIFSAGMVLYSVPRVTSLATTTSTGRITRTPFFSAAARIAPRLLDHVVLGEALADGLALREQEGVGHAAAEDEDVDLVERGVSRTLSLPETFAPPTIAANGRLGVLHAARESIASSRSMRKPA